MEHEAQCIARSSQTADFREGITAFVEKRVAVFRGE
jgi:enoyl-CoA hydratase/carnithine racemase